MIFELYKKGVWWSDISPENIVYIRNSEYNEYVPKLTNFSSVTTDYNAINYIRPVYFFNEKSRKSNILNNAVKFHTPEERTKADFFSLSIIGLYIIFLSDEIYSIYQKIISNK